MITLASVIAKLQSWIDLIRLSWSLGVADPNGEVALNPTFLILQVDYKQHKQGKFLSFKLPKVLWVRLEPLWWNNYIKIEQVKYYK